MPVVATLGALELVNEGGDGLPVVQADRSLMQDVWDAYYATQTRTPLAGKEAVR